MPPSLMPPTPEVGASPLGGERAWTRARVAADMENALFDPPRAGAEIQCGEIGRSKVSRAVAISCNPVTFARDAKILVEAGFTLKWVRPVDQFLWSPHIEVVALFER